MLYHKFMHIMILHIATFLCIVSTFIYFLHRLRISSIPLKIKLTDFKSELMIFKVDNFLTGEECRKIIKESFQFKASTVSNESNVTLVDKYLRSSSNGTFSNKKFEHNIKARIAQVLNKRVSNIISMNIIRYQSLQQVRYHYDAWSSNDGSGTRPLTCILYLNTIPKSKIHAGYTAFSNIGNGRQYFIRPVSGTLVCFRSIILKQKWTCRGKELYYDQVDIRSRHAGLPVSKGMRKFIVQAFVND